MLRAELGSLLEQLQTSAERLALDVASGRGPTESMARGEGAVIRNGNRVLSIPERSPITEFPAWSPPRFKGIIRNKAGMHFFAAQATAAKGEHQVDGFVVETLDNKMLAQLLPEVASARIIAGGNISFRIGSRGAGTGTQVVLASEESGPGPQPRRFWRASLETHARLAIRP